MNQWPFARRLLLSRVHDAQEQVIAFNGYGLKCGPACIPCAHGLFDMRSIRRVAPEIPTKTFSSELAPPVWSLWSAKGKLPSCAAVVTGRRTPCGLVIIRSHHFYVATLLCSGLVFLNGWVADSRRQGPLRRRPQCRGGGTGRRKGPKIPRPTGHAASIPALGIILINRLQDVWRIEGRIRVGWTQSFGAQSQRFQIAMYVWHHSVCR